MKLPFKDGEEFSVLSVHKRVKRKKKKKNTDFFFLGQKNTTQNQLGLYELLLELVRTI